MSEKPLPLIHPIYLDVPMLVSFAAALQGGLSLQTEVTRGQASTTASAGQVEGRLGISQLFSTLFDASVSARKSSDQSEQLNEIHRESKAHTEASIAIMLYGKLQTMPALLKRPEGLESMREIEPGALIEVTATLEKNAVDAFIDYCDIASIFTSIGTEQLGSQVATGNKSGKPSRNQSQQANPVQFIRDALDRDRQRTPISNVLMKCTSPAGVRGVVTLRRANLRDLTLSELHKNNVRVVGKVTRVIDEGESMSAFENYGLALLDPTMVTQIFADVAQAKDTVAQFSDVQVHGPAVQILPLMIFV
jgi:hypothetical protein